MASSSGGDLAHKFAIGQGSVETALLHSTKCHLGWLEGRGQGYLKDCSYTFLVVDAGVGSDS